MATIDFTLNGTLSIDDDTWYETLEAFEGRQNEAMYELGVDLEGASFDTIYGEAWANSVDMNGFIDPPSDDKRPFGTGLEDHPRYIGG